MMITRVKQATVFGVVAFACALLVFQMKVLEGIQGGAAISTAEINAQLEGASLKMAQQRGSADTGVVAGAINEIAFAAKTFGTTVFYGSAFLSQLLLCFALGTIVSSFFERPSIRTLLAEVAVYAIPAFLLSIIFGSGTQGGLLFLVAGFALLFSRGWFTGRESKQPLSEH